MIWGETRTGSLGHPVARAAFLMPVRVKNDKEEGAEPKHGQYDHRWRMLAGFPHGLK